MAIQRSRRSRVTSDLCGDAAHAGGSEGADQQDGSQRCAGHRADDAGGPLPSGACEDATKPETADAADPSQAIAVEGHRHRERSARDFTQLRPQGGHGRKGKVRGSHPGACRDDPRLGDAGGTTARRPSGATRTDRHPAPPLAGHRARRRGVPAPDDDPRCRPGGGADLSCYRRCARPIPKVQVGRGSFWLTSSRHQSGEIDWSGRISRCGDEMMRVILYEAAQSMLRSKKWSWLKAWAMQIARRRGMKKAIVALARRLAVIMHRIWVDGTEFRWSRGPATAAA